MPLCPRCSAENAEHMIACWRCAYPIYPPQVADEIARKRREAEEGKELKMLPPESPAAPAVEGAPSETTVITEEAVGEETWAAQIEAAIGAKEALTEVPGEPASREAIEVAELTTEAVKETARQEPKAAAPAEAAPPPKVIKKAPPAAPPVEAKPKRKLAVPFALAGFIGVAVIVVVTAVFILLPRLLQSPQKVVNEFLSAVKAGDNERIKALLTKKDREEFEKAGGTAKFAPLQNVEFEVGETTIQGSEATVKVKLKVTSPIKLEFEAPFICTREGLSWKINAERTTKEVINAAIAAAAQQWSTMLQEILKKGSFPGRGL